MTRGKHRKGLTLKTSSFGPSKAMNDFDAFDGILLLAVARVFVYVKTKVNLVLDREHAAIQGSRAARLR